MSGPLDRIRGKFDALGGPGSAASLFGNVGAKAVAKGFALIDTAASAVIGVLGDAKTAFEEDEASQKRLQAALQANVPAYNGNKDAIEKVLSARLRLGFSDDEQRASLSTLVTRTKDSAKALDLQRLAMDLSRLRGIDLAAASDLVGKAYSGQVGALRRAGIAVDANATATEALAAVQKAAQGQAEAFADSAAGKQAAAQIKVGEAMEKLGEVVSRVATVVLPILADAFTFLVDAAGAVGGAIGVVVQGVQDLGQRVQDTLKPLADLNNLVGSIPGPWKDAAGEVQNSVRKIGDSSEILARSVRDGTDDVVASTSTMVDRATVKLRLLSSEAARQGRLAGSALSKGILEKRDAVDQAWTDLLEAIKNSQSPAQVAARSIGRLTSTALINALKDKDPAVRAQAAATKQILIDQIAATVPASGKLGAKAMAQLRAGMESKDPDIRAASQSAYDAATSKVKTLSPTMRKYGYAAGAAYAAGLRSTYGLVNDAANYVARGATGAFRASSPPGPESPLHLIDKWGERTVEAWADGMTRKAGSAARSARLTVEAVAGAFAGQQFTSGFSTVGASLGGAVASGGSGYSQGGDVHVHLHGLAVAPTPAQSEQLAQVLGPAIRRVVGIGRQAGQTF